MTNLKEKAYEIIRNRIIICEYQPGSIVDEKAISTELQMSRTPVREALNKLAEEGLLNIMPRRAIVVSQISIKDIMDLYDIRIKLEPSNARAAAIHADKKVMEDFKKKFSVVDGLSTIEYSFLDANLHLYIAQCTGNKMLLNIMDGLMAQTQRVRIISSNKETRRKKGYSEHIDIINSIIAGDADQAEKAMRNHIAAAGEDYLQLDV